MKGWKRCLAMALVVAVLCSFSCAFLLVNYPGHACCGDGCQVCAYMNVVDALLHRLPGGAVLLLFAVVSVVVTLRLQRVLAPRAAAKTPILLKTKLLR